MGGNRGSEMSTFYATFPDPVQAQLVARLLLDDGIEQDDLSLLSPKQSNIEAAAPPSTGDATFFVGAKDDPAHALVNEDSPDADYEAVEVSKVGGGISTSNSDENVESVDQMEDSQSVAEDQIYPRDDTSNSQHELDDLNRAVRTGFPTPVTPLDTDSGAVPSDRSLESIWVPGVGMVFGGGDFATAAFDWSGKGGDLDAPSFLTYLQDEGVPPAVANDLLSQYANGSAVLAVTLAPPVNEEALDEVAERYGAIVTGSYGAPRF
jgi:hypothetical protein